MVYWLVVVLLFRSVTAASVDPVSQPAPSQSPQLNWTELSIAKWSWHRQTQRHRQPPWLWACGAILFSLLPVRLCWAELSRALLYVDLNSGTIGLVIMHTYLPQNCSLLHVFTTLKITIKKQCFLVNYLADVGGWRSFWIRASFQGHFQ